MQRILFLGCNGEIVNFDNVTRIFKQGSYVLAELTTGKTAPLYYSTDANAIEKYFDNLLDRVMCAQTWEETILGKPADN